MLFRKKPAEERSPQELEIALQEAEMPQKGLKPFLHKNGKKLVAVLVIAAILVVLLVPKGQKKAVNAETAYTQVTPENRDITNVYSESGVLNAANSYTVKATVKGDVLTAVLRWAMWWKRARSFTPRQLRCRQRRGKGRAEPRPGPAQLR